MKRHSLTYTLNALYKVVGLSEQAVSQHRKRRERVSIELLILMKQIDDYRQRHPGCGLAKMYYQIKVSLMGRDRFIAFAKELGYQLNTFKSGIKTTIPGYYVWPNLIEGMLVTDVNRVWQSDITYFRVGERFYYITFILDVYSRKIVGYAVAKTLEAKANIKALKQAVKLRGKLELRRLIHHSDRGSQYTSQAYLQLLLEHGCLASMGQKGQDNAYAERINGIIKNEYLVYRSIVNMTQLKRWVKQAINQYNDERIHSSLPNRYSPNKFEEEVLTLNHQKRPKVIIHADGKCSTQHANSMVCSLPEKALQAHICPIY